MGLCTLVNFLHIKVPACLKNVDSYVSAGNCRPVFIHSTNNYIHTEQSSAQVSVAPIQRFSFNIKHLHIQNTTGNLI